MKLIKLYWITGKLNGTLCTNYLSEKDFFVLIKRIFVNKKSYLSNLWMGHSSKYINRSLTKRKIFCNKVSQF